MVWGDFLSTIQLAAGLNTAYFSLTELREPVFTSEQKALERLRFFIDERLRNQSVAPSAQARFAEYIQVLVDFNTLYLRYKTMDKLVGRACLLAAISYTLLLVYASFRVGARITTTCAISLSGLGFSPVLLCLVMNVVALQHVRGKISKRRWNLEQSVLSLSQGGYKGSELAS